MQLYHFPSPNPQKVTFAVKELGLDSRSCRSILERGNTGSRHFPRTTGLGGCRFWWTVG